jgi:hypothetical protein
MARRLLGPLTATGTLGLLIGGVFATGTAVAATGGTFLLGKSNSAGAVTSLTNTSGTALSLKSPKGHAPLAVNQKAKVANLNSDLLDGLDSSQLQRRVAAKCAGTTSVQSITSSGAVTCTKTRYALFETHGTYTVPAGATRLLIRLRGGGGGGCSGAGATGGGGGQGALLEAIMTVSPGQKLDMSPGVGGAGFNASTSQGCNDGGASQVAATSGGTAVLYAGGGGHGNFGESGIDCGVGGSGGTPQVPTATGITALTGDPGLSGGSGNCSTAGAGAAAGFPGGGGNGAPSVTNAPAGTAGYIYVQVLN